MRGAERMDLRGRLTLRRRRPDGALIDEIAASNMIVLSGREMVARLFVGALDARPIGYVGLGTGSELTLPERTALVSEIWRQKIKDVEVKQDSASTTDPNRFKVTLEVELDLNEPPPREDGQPHALTEAGLFTAAERGEGLMYNRVVFPTINKTADFRLTLIWEIIF